MTQDKIIEALLAFIAGDDATDDAFNAMALDLFAYQYENNAPFQRFSRQRECTPRTVKSWRRKACAARATPRRFPSMTPR